MSELTAAGETREPIIKVEDMTVQFKNGRRTLTAVNHVSFEIYKGETFALVGESGSGKTTIGRSIVRLNQISTGRIIFKGQTISGKLKRAQEHELVSKLQMIFQDPMASLNERAKVNYIVAEGLINTKRCKSQKELSERVDAALSSVGLLPEFASRFPHEFSGGQRQRIGIARALIMEPEFIIADEPISALDVSIRAQVLNLLNKFKRERGLSYLFIAHDLSVVRFIADRIAVIYNGKIVEVAESEQLFKNPLHPYTKNLLAAAPTPDPRKSRTGGVTIYDPTQHHYEKESPSFTEIEPGHFVYGNAPEIEVYRKELTK
ncbi:ABC transporter ATP-binding protein [Clostridia bacterium]|nr:ABC transporter ATP-binding protein [Clostridia bacterium]